ncbi:MAG: hypothetical protein IJJ71_11990 [Treponema sp.]|uniref:hypothetical protein n=1 Tax=Treponema sp. TaxID=166 RepID=UPI0025CC85CB|nr:hypothetical protein [Treponema sp.]MBR0496883.1 hypothetical protein [Treponema sp.]
MKKISTAAALLAASALLFGSLIVACSPHGTGIIDEGTKTTAGTISANAVSGTTATLTDSTGGTYTFISGASANIVPVLSTASTPAGGTWTYKEKNISFNKYEGTFTGDIAKIGKEATSFKLTVKKVANAKGELMTAKKEASFDFNLTTSAFTATIPEVEASATKAEEEPEVVADPKTVVNAKFDFLVTSATAGIDLNTETDLTEYAKPASDVVTAAKGASLKFITGNGSKVKYENNTNYGLYVGSKKDSLSTVAAAGSYKELYSNKDWIYGKLELETTDSAKITLNVSGNGDTHYGRWVVVTNVKGKIVGFAENLGRVENGTTEIKELKVNDGNLVNKGKYTIWMHGSRINSITVKNDLTADIVEIPIKTITLASDKTTLKVGATTSTTVTATVNPSNVNVAYDIDYTSSNTDLLTVTKDTTDKNKATVAIKEGATVTDDTAVTITATVKGTTISNTCKITVNKGSSVKLATAKTYDFTDLPLSAFEGLTAWASDGKLTDTVTRITMASGNVSIKKGSKFKTNITSSNAESAKTKYIQFNSGNTNSDFSTTATPSNADLYLSFEIDGTGSVTATVTGVQSNDTSAAGVKGKAAFVDANGNLLGDIWEYDISGENNATVAGTVSATIANTNLSEEDKCVVYLLFNRGTISKGSLRVTTVNVTPAE